MSDAAAVDAALVDVLASDATLMALCADGVYFDIAPSGKTSFVLVSLISHFDEWMEGSVAAFQEATYLVKAVDLNTSASTAKQAAARIDALLQGGTLTIDGFSHMVTARRERIRGTEPDPDEPELHWQHQGGRYAVVASPTS